MCCGHEKKKKYTSKMLYECIKIKLFTLYKLNVNMCAMFKIEKEGNNGWNIFNVYGYMYDIHMAHDCTIVRYQSWRF